MCILGGKMIPQRIEEACRITGHDLAEACRMSGVRYGTLHQQIALGREIPASTIARLSRGLRLPVQFFFDQEEGTQGKATPRSGWDLAQSANSERAACSRAGFQVTTDHILDWYESEGGVLKNWEWFEDQIDLYHPLNPTDRIMHPIQIGKRSTTAERLMLAGNRDYYKVVGSFDDKVISRAMRSHKMLEHAPYFVSNETLDVIIKGQRVRGGYRKVTMRVTDPNTGPVTAVFSKLTWLDTFQDVEEAGSINT